jgi:hypothetical protein
MKRIALVLLLAACIDQSTVPTARPRVATNLIQAAGASRALVVLNGSQPDNILPGVGVLSNSGRVIKEKRFTQSDVGNSWSVFGITQNSLGDVWTSSEEKLIQLDAKTLRVVRTLPRGTVEPPPFFMTFIPVNDRLIGWSRVDGYLYQILPHSTFYLHTRLGFVGMHPNGLTGMAFVIDHTIEGTLHGVDNINDRLIKMDINTGEITVIAQLPPGDYVGMALAPNGTLFIANTQTRTLLQVDTSGNKLSETAYTSSTPITGITFLR